MKKVILFLIAIVYSNISFGQENMVKIQADISNRNGDVLFVKNNKIIVKEIKVEGSGHFSTSFDVKEGMYQLFDGKEYTEIYLKNGYDLNIKIDASKFDESIVYSGKGAAENNYLAKKIVVDSNFNYDEFLVAIPEELDKKIAMKQNADLAVLKNGNYDSNFVVIQKKSMEEDLARMKMEFKKKLAQLKLNNAPSPSFIYVNNKGEKVKLEDLRGKYVYIDVWATWCGPCRGEIPFLQKIEEKYKGKNITFVSLSIDAEKDFEKWKTFVKDKSLGGVQLFGEKAGILNFITTFGINTIPRFILIDPAGKVVDSDAARPSEARLETLFDSLLK